MNTTSMAHPWPLSFFTSCDTRPPFFTLVCRRRPLMHTQLHHRIMRFSACRGAVVTAVHRPLERQRTTGLGERRHVLRSSRASHWSPCCSRPASWPCRPRASSSCRPRRAPCTPQIVKKPHGHLRLARCGRPDRRGHSGAARRRRGNHGVQRQRRQRDTGARGGRHRPGVCRDVRDGCGASRRVRHGRPALSGRRAGHGQCSLSEVKGPSPPHKTCEGFSGRRGPGGFAPYKQHSKICSVGR